MNLYHTHMIKKITSQSNSMSSKSDEEDDYQLNLDNDVENNLHVLSRIFPDMSPSKPKTIDRKAQEKLDYFTNNNDRTKITTDDVSSSSVFNKERTLSQNKNSNSNNTKVSLYITFQRNNTTTKPMIVKDKKKKYKGHLMIKNVLTQ